MFALIRKEINTFFASAVGYLVVAVFLILNGLFLWIFKGQYNILDSGFADLSPFFQIAPWVLLLLIPAVTMRSIAEEKKQGTLELLLTKPIKPWQLVLGKYLGSLALIILTLIPSFLYIITIHQLGKPIGNLDIGSTIGSYIALILLGASYTAIGIFASSITKNQIIAFLIALFLCFTVYFGFGGLADYVDYVLEQLGMQLHFERMSLGVIDTRDVFYFLGIIFLFIVLTIISIRKITKGKKVKVIVLTLIAVVVLNLIGNSYYSRFDLTQDKRFTLSEATQNLVLETPAPIVIEVLLKGDFPSEFKRLQSEVKQLLEEFNAINPNVQYIFTNPLEEEVLRDETINQLQQFGLTPMEVSVQESGKTEIETIVPWAILSFQNRSVKVPLVKNTIGATSEERVNNSIQQLEYVFADGLTKLLNPKKYKIAVLKGNGQLPDAKIADFIRTLQEYYFVGAFTLDSVAGSPQKTLQGLQKFDMIINAKPTQAFSEKEKYVLDQFIMHGGKSLWLLESTTMEIDSLMNPEGSSVALMQDLRLGDALFSYGLRVNPVLVNDLYSAPLVLASGEGNETQFTPYPWFYESLTKSSSDHPIVKNIESVKFEFSNQIDTLKNNIKKTILLTSSEKSKLEGVPKEIRLDIIRQKPDMNSYSEGAQNLAVLLEGSFKSTYKDRIKPVKIDSHKDNSIESKMIVIADGDIIKNRIRKGQPLELGYDPYLNLKYGNKEFLLNAVNYLLDDSGLIEVRSKEIKVPFLNIEKVVDTRVSWQIVNILVPLLLLGLFGFVFSFLRKRKYKESA
ncbi:gliding motility-associated ABC transporter substrate-binding protein GldG [Aquimarina gracilis]|uniref:Gliding motility-associated ABC transporter substrate-binding protein GldG n=1 Tax=Aquimarina gracilis TaxID=874422 RepID=A0ABU5ZW33_9FLAO|nr:gliding motility-associated ABC transporter substrate-binding protein GldG [Aquimarina gracilis]MEB3346085.1 gliding motility-associated ABC transporter substrate-binding protein GldG [Aquimarina gracilis]